MAIQQKKIIIMFSEKAVQRGMARWREGYV